MEEQQAGAVFAGLAKQEVQIGDVDFYIGKMPVKQQIRTFKFLLSVMSRQQETPGVVSLLSAFNIVGDEDPGGQRIIGALMSLLTETSHEEDEWLRNALFAEIMWRRVDDGLTKYNPLPGNEDIAFESLGALAMLELEVRAIVVNFHESFSGLLSRLSQAQTPDSPVSHGLVPPT